MIANRAGLADRNRVTLVSAALLRIHLPHARSERRLALQFQSQRRLVKQPLAVELHRIVQGCQLGAASGLGVGLRLRRTSRENQNHLVVGRSDSKRTGLETLARKRWC